MRRKNLFTAALLGFFGLSALGLGGWRWVQTSGSGVWPSTLARVVDSRIVPYSTASRRSISGRTRYRIDYTLEYEAGGEVHSIHESIPNFSTYADAESVRIASFQPRAAHRVWVHPHDPTRYVFEPGVPADAWMTTLVGVILTGLGAFTLRGRR